MPMGYAPQPRWYNNPDLALNRCLPSLVHDFKNRRFWNEVDGETGFPYANTSTTNKGAFDAKGRFVWAPSQMCTRGNDFVNWASLGADGTVALSGNTTSDGVPSYLVTYTSASPTAGLSIGSQPIVLGAPHTYSIRLRYRNHRWVRIALYSLSNTANQIRAFVDLENRVIGTHGASGAATYIGGEVVEDGDGFVRVTISGNVPFTSPTTDANMLVTTCVGDNNTTRVGNGAQIEIAKAHLKPWDGGELPAWRSEFATTGAAWYGDRVGYDPATGECIGQIIEGQRSPLVPKSFNLKGTDILQLAVVPSDSPITYLGGWPAARVTADGTSTTHAAYPASITPSASVRVALQAVVCPITANTRYQLTGSGNWLLDLNGYANFNLTGNGSVTAVGSSAYDPICIYIGGGCYFISVSVMSSASPVSGAACIISPITSGTDLRLPSNTSTDVFDIAYAQAINNASGYNIPIPTFGTPVTQSSDILTSTSVGFFDQTKGTWYAVVRMPPSSDQVRRVFRMDDGTNNNALMGTRTATLQAQIVTINGGVSDFSPSTGNTASAFLRAKMVMVFSSPSKKVCLNGGTVATSSVAFPASGYTTLRVGSALSSNFLQGSIEELRFYRNADATNTQIQTMAT